MKSKLTFYARQSSKRARKQAHRLHLLMKRFSSDPVRNFKTWSEAASLARRVGHNLRQTEAGGRIMLTMDRQRRQVILLDKGAADRGSVRRPA